MATENRPMEDGIEDKISAKRELGTAICKRMAEAIVKLGFPLQAGIDRPCFDAAEFILVTDPYTQSRDLVGFWYDSGRRRIGQIKFHGDGTFYAEYDIVRPHPGNSKYFVEAIDAWGNANNIKTEAKLLEVPQ